MTTKWIYNFIGGVALTVFSALFGSLDTLFYSFLFLMVIDYITGMAAAWHTGTFSSSKGRDGLWKKAGTLLAVAVVYRADVIVPSLAAFIPSLSGWQSPLRDIVIGAFIVNDIISIFENLSEWGVELPQVITDKLAQIKPPKNS